MNKNQFLSRLAAELSKLPKEEIEAAMEFYTEYLDDVGVENEEETIKGLGGPNKIAAQIKSDYAVKQIDNMPEENINIKSAKKGMSAIWWTIVGLFAAPLAVPVTIFLAAMVVMALAIMMAVVLAAGAGVVALLVSSIAILVVGFMSIATAPTSAIMLIGIGIIAIAVTSMIIVGVIVATKAIFRQLLKTIHGINEKRIARKMDKNKENIRREGGMSHEQ